MNIIIICLFLCFHKKLLVATQFVVKREILHFEGAKRLKNPGFLYKSRSLDYARDDKLSHYQIFIWIRTKSLNSDLTEDMSEKVM